MIHEEEDAMNIYIYNELFKANTDSNETVTHYEQNTS